MGNAPRILLIRESGDAPDQIYCSALESRGFHFDVSEVSENPAGPEIGQGVNAIILELLTNSAAAAADAFRAHARSIAGETGDRKIPILALCQQDLADDLLPADDIDAVMHPPLTAGQIAGRIATLARLNTMHFELARRVETYARYGMDAPDISPPEIIDEVSILIVGEGAHLAIAERALGKGATLIGALTRDMAEDYLNRRAFDAILLDLPGDEAVDFLSNIRRNAKFHSLPVLALLPHMETGDTEALFEAGATDLFMEPIDPRELAARSDAYIKENRFREKLRSVYHQARHMATGDALTGLYSRGFILEHLDRMLEDKARWGEPLTLCGLTIDNLKEINGTYGYAVGDRIIRQIGTLIGQLVRGEDMTARWKGGNFLVILTSTDARDAEVAIARIRGVVNHTLFSVEDIASPIQVRIDEKIVEAGPFDLAEALAKRAFR